MWLKPASNSEQSKSYRSSTSPCVARCERRHQIYQHLAEVARCENSQCMEPWVLFQVSMHSRSHAYQGRERVVPSLQVMGKFLRKFGLTRFSSLVCPLARNTSAATRIDFQVFRMGCGDNNAPKCPRHLKPSSQRRVCGSAEKIWVSLSKHGGIFSCRLREFIIGCAVCCFQQEGGIK